MYTIGPLLYHFEDIPGEGSIELSLEEVKRVSRDIGFEFKVRKQKHRRKGLRLSPITSDKLMVT